MKNVTFFFIFGSNEYRHFAIRTETQMHTNVNLSLHILRPGNINYMAILIVYCLRIIITLHYYAGRYSVISVYIVSFDS